MPSPNPPATSRRCTAASADGSPCRAWAVRTSHPPLCAAHGGGRAPVGAPPGNQNALTHGLYAQQPPASSSNLPAFPPDLTIDCVIADLYHKQQRLSKYIDDNYDTLTPEQLARFHHIHAQGSTRLGRLLRDRLSITGGPDDAMSRAINQALAELSEEFGTDLT